MGAKIRTGAVLVRVVKRGRSADIWAGITFTVADVGSKHDRNEKTTLTMVSETWNGTG